MMADGKLSLLSVGEWNYPELEAIQPLGDACRAYLAARARLDALNPADVDFADAEREVISATMDICFSASANLALDSTVFEMGRWAAGRGRAARSGRIDER